MPEWEAAYPGLVLAARYPDVTWGFTRNPANQIASQSDTSSVYNYKETITATTNKTFDGLNRDASIAALSGGFDARGNLTFDGTRTFTYDLENRLLTGTGGGANLALVYDPEGRLAKYSGDGGSSYTTFLYDGVNLIGEYDNSGGMQRRYLHAPGDDQPWVQFTGSTMAASNASYLIGNYQGSIIAMTDSSGAVTDLYKYGPYGEPRNASNAESWTGSRFRYTGQTMIPEAKLYYYKARVYDPVFGRFLQTDPIGTTDDLNLYAYTSNDPIDQNDPSGTEAGCVTTGSNCNLGTKDPNAAPGATVAIGGGGSATTGRASVAGSAGGAIDTDGKIVAYADVAASILGAKVGESKTGGVVITMMNGKTGDMKGGFVTFNGTFFNVSVTGFHGKAADGVHNVRGAQILIGPGEGISGGPGASNTVTTKPRTAGEVVRDVSKSLQKGYNEVVKDITSTPTPPRIPTNCRGGSASRSECH